MKLKITKKTLPLIILCGVIFATVGYFTGKQYALYQNSQDVEKTTN